MTQSHTTGVGATGADATPEKPKKSPKDKQLADLVKLRAIAMRLTGHLKAMMPDPTDVGKGAAVTPAPPLPPEFDRLLGDRGSIIDSFETLVRVVIRLIDKETEPREPPQDQLAPEEEFDEDELDRRINDELDRIAARRRAADSLEADAA